jgi:hypothetical protein
MSVYDAFVDAGKAATSLEDQTATLKIIREIRGQPRGVREGSVVPDLNKSRFQPRNPPPVPPFPNTYKTLGKRSRDDAFREGGSNREGSHSSRSVSRKRRLDVLEEREPVERPVPSTERDLRNPMRHPSCQDQGSPIVIPETQDSPLRQGANTRQRDSEVDRTADEPKSESPEIGNGIHSLPLVQKDVDDVGMLEPAPTSQNPSHAESANSDDVPARSAAASVQEPTSRSSSNYYSPTSGSLHPISKEDAYFDVSASSSAKSAARLNKVHPTMNLTRTKLDRAKETVKTGPITPPSDASRRGHSKATAEDTARIESDVLDPQPRTSSFSNRFIRQDRMHSAESEIDDTQMSPRSRKSLKRSRGNRYLGAAPKAVGVKELSGLFHPLDDKRPLIQERKRQRRETKWDFSEHLEGLSGTDEEINPLHKDQNLNDVQQSKADHFPSDSDEAEDIAGLRSKSEALSDATNKDSNASTERPAVSASLNRVGLSQSARNQTSSHGVISDTMAAEDSDKENTNLEQAVYSNSLDSDLHEDAGMATQGPSEAHEKEHANDINQLRIGKDNNDSVIGILNEVTSTRNHASTKAKGRNASQLPREITQHSGDLVSLPDHASLKRSNSRKKKSHVEDEETTKPAIEKEEVDSAVKAVTTNASKKLGQQSQNSTAKSKPRRSVIPLPEPDEQLSQDLQASAQAGNHRVHFGPKKAGALVQNPVTSLANAATVAGGNPSGGSSNRPREEITETNQAAPLIDQGPNTSGDLPKNLGPSGSSKQMGNRDPSKDGKIGLGFSQSPPHRNRGFTQPKPSVDNLGSQNRAESSESLPNEKAVTSFLKKSKSFKKGTSSQSWSADTPSRSAQTSKNFDSTTQHISVDIPGRTKSTLGSENNAEISARVQMTTSGSVSKSESDSDEYSSADTSEGISKANQAPIKNGQESSSAAILSVEISSDSSSTEPDAGSSSSNSISNPGKSQKDGPTIVSKGNNVYHINGTPIVVPPGFTLDAYLAMRADLASQPPRPNGRSRIANSGKSATPTLNQKGSSATPVPAPVRVAPKKGGSKGDDSRPANGMKAKTSDREDSSAAKTQDLPKPPLAIAAKKRHTPKPPAVRKEQATGQVSGAAKISPLPPTSITSESVAPIPKIDASNVPGPAKKPSTMSELKAQREADRANRKAASSAKTSRGPSRNLAKSQDFLAGEDSESESESETESETESTSSDGGVATSKAKSAVAKTRAAGVPTVDLSIRDPSPSSDGED